jgi:hypothetical protein
MGKADVMATLDATQRRAVGRQMHDEREPWGMALWNSIDRQTRERLASDPYSYHALASHWPPCAEFDCDALAVELDTDGEFCCAEHEVGK